MVPFKGGISAALNPDHHVKVAALGREKQKYGAGEYALAIISALHAIGCYVDFLVHQPMIIYYRGICFP
ncbi:hypothetical protein T265_05463 [Opisthorchis viverrini]|uniref:Uncharacterized protein n=1 Tax=Opisthorchis viverrini TaxID=6198 RepID=A0A074ZNX6_OPIVI|nr:hypothetical protein T265_05463 [Opisthorchis viverrini]KER27502.1 hypothetical protein T265_05463 [Opisthorchis viverrini]